MRRYRGDPAHLPNVRCKRQATWYMRRAEVNVQRLEAVVSTNLRRRSQEYDYIDIYILSHTYDYEDTYQVTNMSANISSYKVAIIPSSTKKYKDGRQTWRARRGHGREEICEKQGSILSKTVAVVVCFEPSKAVSSSFLAFEQS